jgi:hypothetical protein
LALAFAKQLLANVESLETGFDAYSREHNTRQRLLAFVRHTQNQATLYDFSVWMLTNMQQYTTVSDLDVNKLSFGESCKRNIDIGITKIPIRYSGVAGGELYLQLPEMESKGIRKVRSGKEKFILTLDMANQDHVECKKALNDIDFACVKVLVHRRFSNTALKYCEHGVDFRICRSGSGPTQEIREKTSVVLPFVSHGEQGTTFVGADGTPLSWDDVRDRRLSVIPLVHVHEIIASPTRMVRVRLVSAIVTDIQIPGMVRRQWKMLLQMPEEKKQQFQESYAVMERLQNKEPQEACKSDEEPVEE